MTLGFFFFPVVSDIPFRSAPSDNIRGKRSGFGFSQGAGHSSSNKLKDLLKKQKQQQQTEDKYVQQWNNKFEELFGKDTTKSGRSQIPSKTGFWRESSRDTDQRTARYQEWSLPKINGIIYAVQIIIVE